ncbi:M48 family metalloprotease [Halorhodospira halochloris]|uniref:M48 family metalloprotease n=1 Tax=Halorhodospira halochloris TaxID=1052 RepID=UPI001EE904C2|nr:M48 family metalloprotease [Halorhodospira halochloris]MCG5530665.1 M48 family metalloprotease [Halorhodospira halochloris]
MPAILCRAAGSLACAILIALAAQPSALAEQIRLPDLGPPGGDTLPIHKERELGSEIMRKVRSHMKLHNDVEINQYIHDLGQRLAAHSNAPDFGYQFFVVEDEQINAFALPGGHIGVHSGLIRKTESESELAGVLAHEIAHVSERHIARQFAQSQRLNLQTAASILAAIIIGAHNPQAGTAAAMAGIAAPIQQQLGHSRQHEREADRIGIRNLAAANLDPHGMPVFFERLAEFSRHAEEVPEYLRTHPLTEARMSEARSIAERLEGGDVFESGHHSFIRARLEVLANLDGRISATARMADRLHEVHDPSARAGALYGLALAIAYERRDYEQALALLNNLQQIDGERLYVLLGRAEIHRKADQHQEALAIYQDASSLYPGNRAVIFRHAETLLAIDQAEQARRMLSRAARQSHNITADLMRLYAEAAHESGNQAESHIAYARYHHLRGDINMALAQLENAIRLDDDRYHQARASALYEQWQERHSAR